MDLGGRDELLELVTGDGDTFILEDQSSVDDSEFLSGSHFFLIWAQVAKALAVRAGQVPENKEISLINSKIIKRARTK